MTSYLKNILFVVLVFLSIKNTLAQGNTENITIRFLKEKIEIKENQTFFNVLILENKGAKNVEFDLNINVPRGWKLIGSPIERINLSPNQTRSIPVRVAVSNSTQGGVGYSVNASVIKLNGETVETASSFFAFPIKKELKIKTSKSTQYFNNKTLKSNFSIKISNKGNINELLDIKIIPDYNLLIDDNKNNDVVYSQLELSHKTDTSLNFVATINPKTDYSKVFFFKITIEIKSRSSDSTITKTVWFRYLDWEYYNRINESNNPLTIRLIAQNLFNNSEIKYRAEISGRILFKDNRTITYSFQNRTRDNKTNNLWINSKWLVTAENKSTTLIIGDYSGSFEQNMYGRGIYIEQKIRKDLLKASVTKRLLSDITNYGISYKIMSSRFFNLESGLAFTQNKSESSENSIAFIKPSFSIMKNHHLAFSFGINHFTYQINEKLSTNGYGYRFDYTGNFKKLKIGLTNEYGSPNYVGYYKGKFKLQSRLEYKLRNEKTRFYMYFSSLRDKPTYLENEVYVNDRFSNKEQVNFIFHYKLKKNLSLNFGSVYDLQATNNISGLDKNSTFGSQTLRLEAGVRVSDPTSYKSLYLSGRFGLTDIYSYTDYLNGEYIPDLNLKKPYTVAEIRANFNGKHFGIFAIYFNGPREITQQFSYFYAGFFAKTFSIMPYYENYLYKKNLKISLRTSYNKDLSSSNSRYNINTNLSWFAKNNWSFYFLNSIAIQQRKETITQSSDYYSSSYFEFGIKKSFGIRQPRIKYYKFNAEFFKDYNGNGEKDENEAGISNVLVNFKRQYPEQDTENPDYNNEFISNELLSNQEGQIYYENMPGGDYILDYERTGVFSENIHNQNKQEIFNIQKDTTIFIPFKGKNKIFGHIVLHRDKFTQAKYSLQNIRVSVQGNEELHTSLTDADGYFEVVIPISETYKIWVNNVFKENFNLRQKYYKIRFNGYKQYEVNFDFDEKKREIIFRDDEIYETEDNFRLDSSVLIQQTNLRGIVQSEKLYPIFANISVRNQKNELISEVVSSVNTGKFSTTFFTGENYNLTVSFSGYWTQYEELNINQITTFDYITRNIVLQKIKIGEKIKTNNLLFDPLKSKLSETAKAELDNIVIKLSQNIDVTIDVVGYTDNEESLKIDAERLSATRAIAVMDYLVSNGIASNRIKPVGYGDKDPVVENNSKQAREQNRRVEIKVNGFNKEVKAH